MKRTLTNTLLCLALSLPVTGMASDDIQQQGLKDTAGFGIGALLGGLIGGPVGAIAGATGGSWLGDHEDERQAQHAGMEAQLADQTRQISALQARIESERQQYRERLDSAIAEQRESLLSQLCELRIDLYFQTGSAELRREQIEQLESLLTLMQSFSELSLRLQGYGDHRGKDHDNRLLSQARIDSIIQILNSQGIDRSRLHGQALGESASQQPPVPGDALFFDRKVSLTLSREG